MNQQFSFIIENKGKRKQKRKQKAQSTPALRIKERTYREVLQTQLQSHRTHQPWTTLLEDNFFSWGLPGWCHQSLVLRPALMFDTLSTKSFNNSQGQGNGMLRHSLASLEGEQEFVAFYRALLCLWCQPLYLSSSLIALSFVFSVFRRVNAKHIIGDSARTCFEV